jgi:acetolactate synthase-1/2/3 large subunit
MTKPLRGADIVMRSLERLGSRRVFTLSGNHIMSLFDAALETKLDLVHVRHEGAAVHMADAWGRLTGEAGIAMVTGGPGHANAVGALFTALGAESPVVLLSGHATTWELGRGGFQEIRQADMAAPVAKASWTSSSAANLGRDIGEAMRIATSGRPGPVNLNLPSDLLEQRVESNAVVWPSGDKVAAPALAAAAADAVLAAIADAARPIIMAGPQLSNVSGRALLLRLEAACNAPAVIIESPRGIADATLGAFPDLVRQADLVVLVGKALDFTTKWATGASFDPAVRVITIDADSAGLHCRCARRSRDIDLTSGIGSAP